MSDPRQADPTRSATTFTAADLTHEQWTRYLRLDADAQRRFLEQRQREAEFAEDFAARPIKWSGHNLSRMLRSTGERPDRVRELRSLLGLLGLGNGPYQGQYPSTNGWFDHGDMWGRNGKPWAIVGHPYELSLWGVDRDAVMAELRSFSGSIGVFVDDRPSYYGFGTHHVRVEVIDLRKPFRNLPSTKATRSAAAAFRRELADLT